MWKLGITAYLEKTAEDAVSTFQSALTKMRAGEPVESKGESPLLDPYDIAEAEFGARIDLL
jgi:hypothetical protein